MRNKARDFKPGVRFVRIVGTRDRALLLVGYTGGLRRSELAAFTVDDLAWVPEGAVLTLRRSTTDQRGQGRSASQGSHAATRPVSALRQWLEAAGIVKGALFREVDRQGKVGELGIHRNSVGGILKQAVAQADLIRLGLQGIR